jgi:phospholipid/cholesterol/gamma-HCH transport system substrate-binding protein
MQQDNGLELKVGLFVLIALAVVGILMVVFGRLGEGFSQSYHLVVSFPNANGLLKGADVALAGATVGRVEGAPQPLPQGNGVLVSIKVYKTVKIHEDSAFSIGEVGMLGDRNVQIDPLPGSDAPFLQDGDRVKGTRAPGLASLTEAAQPAVEEIKAMMTTINNKVLTPEATEDLRVTIKNLRSATGRLDSLLAQAQNSKGAVGRLLNDRKTADDLSDFIYNLRHKGVLFYSDLSSEEKDKKDGNR